MMLMYLKFLYSNISLITDIEIASTIRTTALKKEPFNLTILRTEPKIWPQTIPATISTQKVIMILLISDCCSYK